MPELPEVETIVRGLRQEIGGRVIKGIEVRRERSVEGDRDALTARVPGCAVLDVRRRGKLLLLDLGQPDQPTASAPGRQPDLILAFHLRMTGRLHVPARDEHGGSAQPGKHTHLVFTFADDGPQLLFEDPRTFGVCRVGTQAALELWKFYRTLGPEPLKTESCELAERVAGRAARVKSLLLDQTVVAGIGNIYADEALHRAGIRPDAQASRLGMARLTRLFDEVRQVLCEAIADCGSSISDYRDARGNAGAFQNKFRAYGRAGKPCVRCGALLRRTSVAGRTSSFCPRCQKY